MLVEFNVSFNVGAGQLGDNKNYESALKDAYMVEE